MSTVTFIKNELASAIARGVRQCVVIGSPLHDILKGAPEQNLRLFTVHESQSRGLPSTLETAGFDKRKPSLFVWFGSAGFRTVEAVLSGLSFIASLPGGSGVVFDYAVERTSRELPAHTALDALASRVELGDRVKYLIQPQAVAAMLRGLGFQQIVDLAQSEAPASGGGHLVSATV